MSNLEINEISDGFSVGFRGRIVLRHTAANAAFSFGSGSAVYRMSHGNFRISDRLKRRNPCSRFEMERGEDGVVVRFPEAALKLSIRAEDERLVMRFGCDNPEINRIWMRLEGRAGEHIYGCGEQYSRLDLKGSNVPLWVSEQGVGRGHNLTTLGANLHSDAGGTWYTTYFPVPAFVSSDNWYCVCAVSAWSRFDFRNADSTWLEFWEVPREVTVGVEAGPAETLESMSRLLGRQPPPPEWVYDGLWLGVQGGSEKIECKLKEALDAGVKVGALWVQDWEGKRETSFGRQLMWDWQFDAETYPDLPRQIEELRRRGVRFLGYINPFLAVEGKLYRQASERGLCIKNRNGKDYLVTVTTFPAALLDLTNPDAVSWIKEVIKKNLLGIGLSGWMADYGEYLPTDCILHSGESAETFHNRYPVLWAQANREAVEEAGKLGEAFFFMRSGYLGSSGLATGYWAGDQMVDFSRHDGLPSIIPAAVSLGFSGVGVWHADVGGFTSLAWTKRTEELFMRWAELSAFSPIMRSHESNRPDTNWQFNSSARTLSHLALMTDVYTAMKPYHRAVIREYVESGLPPIRHPYIHYPDEESLHKKGGQYLYGRDLLVAPVVHKGRRRVTPVLPRDEWVHLWTGQTFSGGRCPTAAPLGRPAVFYRASSKFGELFREIGSKSSSWSDETLTTAER